MSALTRRELRGLIALFVLTLPAVTSRLYSSDEVQYFSYLRSLWFDRDVSFDNEYRHFYDRGVARTQGFELTFLELRTPTGLRENFGTLGCAILWAPFYGVADLTTRVLSAHGSELTVDGYSRLYVAAVAYGSAVYGFAALLLSIAAARQLTGSGVLAGIAIWFGTPLLFYMYAAPPFAHACSAFAVALFVTVWLYVRNQWSPLGLIALGAAAALMTMVREQDGLYAVGPAVDFGISLVSLVRKRAAFERRGDPSPGTTERMRIGGLGRSIAAAAAGGATFAVVYAPQLLAYLALNDRAGPSRLVTRKMMWTAPHAAGVLASPEHGLLAWTPLAILAIFGLVHLWVGSSDEKAAAHRDHRRVAGCLVLMLAMQVYVSGSVRSWTVAGAFGQRRFVGATILLVIGFAAFWRAVPQGWPRRGAAVLVAVAIWWNIGLTALFGAGWMDRQRLDLDQNVYDVFVTLPRTGPGLAWRYLFERESFYKSSVSGAE